MNDSRMNVLRRASFHLTISVLRIILFFPAGALLHGQTYPVGDHTQLFLDQQYLTSPQGIRLTMNPPLKLGKVVTGDRPWDAGWISGAGTVLEDGGRYRMWYTGMPISEKFTTFRLCYAESADAIHWRKPNLGIYEWQGSKANNILMDTNIENAGGVFIDPKAAPEERYKLVAIISGQIPTVPAPEGPGVYIYISADGLHWKLYPKRLFPFVPDTVNQAFYDPRIDRYVAFMRVWNPLRKVGRLEIKNLLEPWPYDKSAVRTFSWKGPVQAPSTEIPTAFGTDEQDPPKSDFYTSAAVQYPWADRAYLMFPSAYLHYPDPPKGKYHNDGPLDIQMAVSSEGKQFSRVSRQPYIELGLQGEGDSGSLYMFIGMIRRGNWIYQYYGGGSFTHASSDGYDELIGLGGAFAVRQRVDGFVSADAGMAGGSFVTPPLQFEGDRLWLNMNASAMGEVLVEVEDAVGHSLPGFSFAECDALHRNSTRQLVSWNGKSDLSSVRTQPIRLSFRLRAVKLYSFQFGHE